MRPFGKKPKGRLESLVQAGVWAYLQTRQDIEFWRANTGAAKFGDYYVRFGDPGAADIQGYQAPTGRFFGVECKREIGGQLTEAQRRWGENVVNHGGLYIVARDVEVVAAGLGPEQVRVQKIRKERVIHR